MSSIDISLWKKAYYTHLLSCVRPEDKRELQILGSLYGYSWQQMFARSIQSSQYLRALCLNGACHGVVGIRTYTEEDYACIWFICSPIFRQYPMSLCRTAKHILTDVSREYPLLGNCVSAQSLPHMSSFLQYCGFIMCKETLFFGGEYWYPFFYRRDEEKAYVWKSRKEFSNNII